MATRKKKIGVYEPLSTKMTNALLNSLADELFTRFIETEDWDKLNATESTILAAKLGARFSAWAGDLIDF